MSKIKCVSINIYKNLEIINILHIFVVIKINNMDEIVKQAFINHPFGVLTGIALIVICFFVGLALLLNGWPKFKR
jgi:hypothetical protein